MTEKSEMGYHRRQALLEIELREHGEWDGKTHFVIMATSDTGPFHENASESVKTAFIIQANNPTHAELRLKKEVSIGERDELVIKPATAENLLALFTFTDNIAQVETVT